MVTNTIQEQGKLSAVLSVKPKLQGVVNPIHQLIGLIDIAPVELQGKISTSVFLKGIIKSAPSMKAALTIPAYYTTDEYYEGNYQVTPRIISQKLETKDKVMTDDVKVLAIPYYETSNLTGKTVYIGGE